MTPAIAYYVLVVSFMTPYGWTESSHYDEYETQTACDNKGKEYQSKLPSTFELNGKHYPSITFTCEIGRVNVDRTGWSKW